MRGGRSRDGVRRELGRADSRARRRRARDLRARARAKPVSCMALVNNGSDLWVGGAAMT